jgi:hypothetical protein
VHVIVSQSCFNAAFYPESLQDKSKVAELKSRQPEQPPMSFNQTSQLQHQSEVR